MMMRKWIMLAEGRDAPLFHFTTMESLIKILETDRLGHHTQGANLISGVALTRNEQHPYWSAKGPVMLVLDQSALVQQFRLEPKRGDSAATLGRESEERIAQPITPLHQYLIKIAFRPWILEQIVADKPSRQAVIAEDDIALIRDYVGRYNILIGSQKPQPKKTARGDPRNR
jgi:hypothetical protein